jgi:hypothetical protein
LFGLFTYRLENSIVGSVMCRKNVRNEDASSTGLAIRFAVSTRMTFLYNKGLLFIPAVHKKLKITVTC